MADKIKSFAENGLELSLGESLENLKGDSTISMQLSNNKAKWHKSYSDEFNSGRLQSAIKRKQEKHKDEKNKKSTTYNMYIRLFNLLFLL
mgnify:CR=1 FL=1